MLTYDLMIMVKVMIVVVVVVVDRFLLVSWQFFFTFYLHHIFGPAKYFFLKLSRMYKLSRKDISSTRANNQSIQPEQSYCRFSKDQLFGQSFTVA